MNKRLDKLDYLREIMSKDRPFTKAESASHFECCVPTVERCIRELIEDGHPIHRTGGGIWYLSSANTKDKFVALVQEQAWSSKQNMVSSQIMQNAKKAIDATPRRLLLTFHKESA